MTLRTPQQVRSHITVGRILHSATALIRQNGCAGLTVSDIARGAGIPSGSIYHYFPDRGAIIGQLAEQYRVKNQRTVSQSLAAMKTDVAGLGVTLLDTYRELHQQHPIARDIFMGMTMDVQLRAMGTQYVQEHVEFVFDRVKHLFDHGQYEPVKQVILLSMHCRQWRWKGLKRLMMIRGKWPWSWPGPCCARAGTAPSGDVLASIDGRLADTLNPSQRRVEVHFCAEPWVGKMPHMLHTYS
jgi:AcrR family transcriptional regulator